MEHPAPPSTTETRRERIMQTSLIWDNHACMPLRPGDVAFLDRLSMYRDIGASVVSLNVGFDVFPWTHTFKMLATFRTWIKQNSEAYALIETADDVIDAKRSGRLGGVFDIEGGCALADRPELVEVYYALGVRWMLIAYNQNNALGGGCQDEDPGLTAFGKRAIDEMQRVGMVVCCSHTGRRTAREVIDYAQGPVIFSHSNPDGVYRHERNIPDELIRACAETGGVIGVNGFGLFLGDNDDGTETIVRHIEYIADLVGPEHVGLGLDYVFDHQEIEDFFTQNPTMFPPEKGYGGKVRMVEPGRIPVIIDALIERGWSDEALAGLLGQNHLRVARAVWK